MSTTPLTSIRFVPTLTGFPLTDTGLEKGVFRYSSFTRHDERALGITEDTDGGDDVHYRVGTLMEENRRDSSSL